MIDISSEIGSAEIFSLLRTELFFVLIRFMELRHLRYFVAVAEELNFTRAAEKMRTAQPSLSQQIRDLEKEIGTPLLTRNKRNVALTEAGRVFLDEVRLVLAQAKRAIASARQAADIKSHKLTIGFVPAAEVKIFPSTLTFLRSRFPDLQIVLKSLTTLEQKCGLIAADIDVGFLRPPLDDPSLASEVVLHEHLVAVLPENHSLTKRAKVSLADLAETPFLQISPSHAGGLFDVIERRRAAEEVSLTSGQAVENVLTLMTLIGLGLGFSLLPDYAQQLVFRGVTTRPLKGPEDRVDLAMAWRKADDFAELNAFRELVMEARRAGRF